MPRLEPARPSRSRYLIQIDLVRRRIIQDQDHENLRQRRIQRLRISLNTDSERSAPLQLSNEVTHPAPMSTRQIKQSIETRPETNQDIKFLDKKQCAVCLSSWKEILLGENHLVFTQCGHVFCRPCALRIASEGRRECAMCKRSFAGVTPPFRRLHLPLDPKLNKNNAV